LIAFSLYSFLPLNFAKYCTAELCKITKLQITTWNRG
jgi:hypothetical protein